MSDYLYEENEENRNQLLFSSSETRKLSYFWVEGMLSVHVSNLREMRSKHFLSSGLGFTWQVSKLSLTGCRLDCWQRRKTIEAV